MYLHYQFPPTNMTAYGISLKSFIPNHTLCCPLVATKWRLLHQACKLRTSLKSFIPNHTLCCPLVAVRWRLLHQACTRTGVGVTMTLVAAHDSMDFGGSISSCPGQERGWKLFQYLNLDDVVVQVSILSSDQNVSSFCTEWLSKLDHNWKQKLQSELWNGSRVVWMLTTCRTILCKHYFSCP